MPESKVVHQIPHVYHVVKGEEALESIDAGASVLVLPTIGLLYDVDETVYAGNPDLESTETVTEYQSVADLIVREGIKSADEMLQRSQSTERQNEMRSAIRVAKAGGKKGRKGSGRIVKGVSKEFPGSA